MTIATRRISKTVVSLPQPYAYGADQNYLRFGKICQVGKFGGIKTDYTQDGQPVYAIPIPCTGYSATNVMHSVDRAYSSADGKFYTSLLPIPKTGCKVALILRGRKIDEYAQLANKFYSDLEDLLHSQGYAAVVLEMTSDIPKMRYDVVIGHSFSASRVHEVEPRVAITISDWRSGSINHPQDTATSSRGVVNQFHFTLSDDMKKQIVARLVG